MVHVPLVPEALSAQNCAYLQTREHEVYNTNTQLPGVGSNKVKQRIPKHPPHPGLRRRAHIHIIPQRKQTLGHRTVAPRCGAIPLEAREAVHTAENIVCSGPPVQIVVKIAVGTCQHHSTLIMKNTRRVCYVSISSKLHKSKFAQEF